MKEQRKYDIAYKEEALKLVEEKGCKKASEELEISYHTLYGWVKAARNGELHLEQRSESNSKKIEDEIQQLRKTNKELAKQNKQLQEENEFLAEATAFFAASRQKSAKKKE